MQESSNAGSELARIDEVEQAGRAFRKRYPEFQYNFVEFFTEHLTDLSRFFRGDLEEMLVFAVIGQVYIRAYMDRKDENSLGGNLGPPPISASRLSDVTGIPRQTVRRKLESLEQRGWIEKAAGASWSLKIVDGQSVARRDLHSLDERAINRIAVLFCGLDALVPGKPRRTI